LNNLACVGTILVIADFVNLLFVVDEVTDCARFFIPRMRIGVRRCEKPEVRCELG